MMSSSLFGSMYTRHPVLDTGSIPSYKNLITFVEDRAGHDRRYAINAISLLA